MNFLNTWRAALRIARRDALRAKGRSILVIAMIALPILGVSAAGITFRTSQLTVEEELTRLVGQSDAVLRDAGRGAEVLQEPTSVTRYSSVHPDDAEPGAAARKTLEELLPGAELVPDRRAVLRAESEHGLLAAEVRELDAGHPAGEGRLTLLGGDFPTAADEVAATPQFLSESGLAVGDTVRIDKQEETYRITGRFEVPDELKAVQMLFMPSAGVLDRAYPNGEEEGEVWADYLAVVDGGISWDQVVELNTQGWLVGSRMVYLDPPPDHEVPLYAEGGTWDSSMNTGFQVVLITAVSLIILEICLLAGPAFAVGARRSRRMLGLVGANGGDRRHIRSIMLASGVVLGLAAAVVGIVLGLLASVLARPWVEQMAGERFGALTVVPLELLAIIALSVLTGLLAALIPAVMASRAPVLESLTGRRGVRRSGRVLSVMGGSAFLLGTALALLGGMGLDSNSVVAVGAILAQLGLVAMTPLLVGAFGRLSRWLPLSGRLALRDAVRNRPRTAPAVAAVLAAVAGSITVATVIASEDAEAQAGYTARAPHGTVVIEAQDNQRLDGVQQAAERTLPVGERADLARLVPGTEACGIWDWGAECGWQRVEVPPERECDWEAHEARAAEAQAEGRRLSADEISPNCNYWYVETTLSAEIALGGPEALRVLGFDDPAGAEALERGHAVVFSEEYLADDGTVSVAIYHSHPQGGGDDSDVPDQVLQYPAVMVDPPEGGQAVAAVLLPADAGEEAGLETREYASVFATTQSPSSAERQAFDGAVGGLVGAPEAYIERGHDSDTETALLIAALFAMLITLGAAGIATGLAQADSEADLNTLAAVGAPPRVRRTLSGLQCAVIALMGVVLGAVSGLIPGVAIMLAQHRNDVSWWNNELYASMEDRPELFIAVPWGTMLQLVVVVPLVAGVLAALLTRSRTGLTRRVA